MFIHKHLWVCCKLRDTNGGPVPVVILVECCMAGKASQPIRFQNQNELLYK